MLRSSLAPTSNASVYTYIIVHGMARNRVISGKFTPKQIVQLAQIDRLALLSLLNLEEKPSRKNFNYNKKLVIDLLDFME